MMDETIGRGRAQATKQRSSRYRDFIGATARYFRIFFISPLIILFSQAFLSAAVPEGQFLSPRRASKVDAAVEAWMKWDHVVGLAVGIIENDRIVYLKGYGFADRENKIPVTAQTMFRWASCSKPLTAIAAMQLVEKGKLDLDANVRKCVPEFPDKGVTITARELLCHESEIVHYTNGRVIVTKRHYDTAHPFADPVRALDTFNVKV